MFHTFLFCISLDLNKILTLANMNFRSYLFRLIGFLHYLCTAKQKFKFIYGRLSRGKYELVSAEICSRWLISDLS